MTKINVFFPAISSEAQRARQTDTESQRDNWLRQMEGSLLDGMNRRDAPSEREPTAPARQSAPSPRHDSARDDRLPAPQHTGQAAYPLKPVLAPPLAAAEASALSPANLPEQARAAYAAALPGAFPTAQAIRTNLASASGVTATAASERADLATRPCIVQRRPTNDANDADDVAAEAPDAPTDAGQLDEKPVWQKRLMHLTGSGKEVDLWIRDSDLSAHQTSTLIQRLAGDMAGMGLRLKGATVNGKTAFRAPSGPAPRGNDLPTEHFIITQPEQDHGTR